MIQTVPSAARQAVHEGIERRARKRASVSTATLGEKQAKIGKTTDRSVETDLAAAATDGRAASRATAGIRMSSP
jgi:hypothetical protein